MYISFTHQLAAEQPNAGRERVKIDISSTLTASEVCDATFQGQDSEFHVLVKSGMYLKKKSFIGIISSRGR